MLRSRARLRFAAPLLAVAALPALLAAQLAPAEYAARRDSLLARLDSGAVVAFGGVEPVTFWPIFVQLPSFDYLTGFNEPDAVLLLVKRGGAGASRLATRSPRSRGSTSPPPCSTASPTRRATTRWPPGCAR